MYFKGDGHWVTNLMFEIKIENKLLEKKKKQ